MVSKIIHFLTMFLFIDARPLTNSYATMDLDELYDYLTKYGYLMEKRPHKLKNSLPKNTTANVNSSDPYTRTEVVTAIKDFQYMFYIMPVTGKLDQETIKIMRMPRCGVNDRTPKNSLFKINTKLTPSGYRKRKYLQNLPWRKNNFASGRIFYWAVSHSFRSSKLNSDDVTFAIQYAVNRWAAVCNVLFKLVGDASMADVVFSFHTLAHHDNEPFDGPGGIYAHANQKQGEVHFDDDETFSMNSKHSQYFVRPATVTDFVQVAIHETGHILGYKHSQNKDSVMFGTLNHNYIAGSNYGLHKEDVSLAKSTYGKCWPGKINSVYSNTGNGKTYFTVGPLAYELNDRKVEVEQSWPRLTSQEWPVFDVVDEWFIHEDGKTYLFSGGFYSYSTYGAYSPLLRINLRWHPKLTHIDAAWNHLDGKTYFISDNMIYKWNKDIRGNNPHNIYPLGGVESGWPRKLQDVFPGAPYNPDTVFRWYADNQVYFFKDRYFYIYRPSSHKLDGQYSTDQWKNICNSYLCTTPSSCRHWKWRPSNK